MSEKSACSSVGERCLSSLSDSSSTMVFVSLRSKAKDDNGGGGGLEVKKLRFEKKTILDVCSNRRLYHTLIVDALLQCFWSIDTSLFNYPREWVVLDAGSFEQKYTIKSN